ncbi:hypothetical protein [Bradyrhizobium sp. ORS 285]|uniref:hypothetical protein n=1 Tax=Bradyrhizobium sp. ORS 285 TaxID=115808 RepID=UPI0006823A3C|nr:hypothetical protein [Bradyrhizobium sp. ORS 285]
MEQAVLVYIRLREGEFGSERECAEIADLAAELQQAIDHHGVGEFDGDEFGGGRCVLFMYGADADQLFGVIAPFLKAAPVTRGGFVVKRYGEPKNPDAAEIRVDL